MALWINLNLTWSSLEHSNGHYGNGKQAAGPPSGLRLLVTPEQLEIWTQLAGNSIKCVPITCQIISKICILSHQSTNQLEIWTHLAINSIKCATNLLNIHLVKPPHLPEIWTQIAINSIKICCNNFQKYTNQVKIWTQQTNYKMLQSQKFSQKCIC